MPLWFWIASAAVVVGMALFSWWGSQPYVHRNVPFSDLAELAGVLDERGDIGGRMLVRPVGATAVVLPFQKYGVAGATGIRFAMPVLGEPELAARVLSAVRGGGFPIVDVPPNADEPRPFLIVNFGRDRTELARLAVHASRAAGATESVAEIWFENVGAAPWRGR